MPKRLLAVFVSTALWLTAVAAAHGMATVHPDSAVATCSDHSLTIPCFLVLQTGGGYAIQAYARNNAAIFAETKSTRDARGAVLPFGFRQGLDAGVVGPDISPSITGLTNGVSGMSKHGTGVSGVTFVTGTAGNFGVLGADANSSPASANVGVEGISNNVGVGGLSSTGVGVSGLALTSGIGVLGFSRDTGPGVEGQSNNGPGVLGNSLNGTGVVAQSFSRPALIASSFFGLLFQGFNNLSPTPQLVASLDGNGNLILAGNITTGGTPSASIRTASGRNVLGYMPKETVPTIEDVGEAQLKAGAAHVPIDPVFAQAMDPKRRYVVFITSNGDSNGLYVTNRTLTAFDVRETKLGQSNVSFSYRIVAAPWGVNAARLPAASVLSAPAQRLQSPKLPTMHLPVVR